MRLSDLYTLHYSQSPTSFYTPQHYIRATKRGAKAANMPRPALLAPAVTTALGLACPLAELAVVAAGAEVVMGPETPEGR